MLYKENPYNQFASFREMVNEVFSKNSEENDKNNAGFFCPIDEYNFEFINERKDNIIQLISNRNTNISLVRNGPIEIIEFKPINSRCTRNVNRIVHKVDDVDFRDNEFETLDNSMNKNIPLVTNFEVDDYKKNKKRLREVELIYFVHKNIKYEFKIRIKYPTELIRITFTCKNRNLESIKCYSPVKNTMSYKANVIQIEEIRRSKFIIELKDISIYSDIILESKFLDPNIPCQYPE